MFDKDAKLNNLQTASRRLQQEKRKETEGDPALALGVRAGLTVWKPSNRRTFCQ